MIPENFQLFVDDISRAALVTSSDLVDAICSLACDTYLLIMDWYWTLNPNLFLPVIERHWSVFLNIVGGQTIENTKSAYGHSRYNLF